VGEEDAADGGRDHRRDRHGREHRRHVARGLIRRLGIAHHRAPDDGTRSAADALHHARDEQHLDAGRERARDRRDHEQREPGDQDRAAAERVGQVADDDLRGRVAEHEQRQVELRGLVGDAEHGGEPRLRRQARVDRERDQRGQRGQRERPRARPDREVRGHRRGAAAAQGANAAIGMSSAVRSSRAISCAFAATPGRTLYAKWSAANRLPS